MKKIAILFGAVGFCLAAAGAIYGAGHAKSLLKSAQGPAAEMPSATVSTDVLSGAAESEIGRNTVSSDGTVHLVTPPSDIDLTVTMVDPTTFDKSQYSEGFGGKLRSILRSSGRWILGLEDDEGGVTEVAALDETVAATGMPGDAVVALGTGESVAPVDVEETNQVAVMQEEPSYTMECIIRKDGAKVCSVKQAEK